MATRSLIGMKKDDMSMEVIYCHWDGYPEYVGLQLSLNYREDKKVQKLMDLGDRSCLEGSPDYENTYKAIQNQDCPARIYKNFDEFEEADKSGAEYFYLWDKGWVVYELGFDDTVNCLGGITDIELKIGQEA